MSQKAKPGEDLSEFRAGLAEPSQTGEKIPEEETDPEIGEELLHPPLSPYDSANLTIALQLLPQDNHPKGRQIIVIVKGETAARPIKLLREAELGQLPEPLMRMLGELQLEINSQKSKEPAVTPSATTEAVAPARAKFPKKGGKTMVPVIRPTESSSAKTAGVNSSSTTPVIPTPPVPAPLPESGQGEPKQASLFDLL